LKCSIICQNPDI